MRRTLPLLALAALALAGGASAQGDRQTLRGGPDGDVFLGCLSCSRFDADAVTNRRGRYGSETGSSSIHNPHGLYGSRYADTSVCNPYARNPPRIVDDAGTVIGYLTSNRHLPDAITQPDVLAWLRDDVCD